MTLKHRIIPILLTDGQGNCVKPVKFQRPYRKVGSLMQYVKILEKRNIEELVILDIEATNENRLIDCEKIKEYTKELFCPVTLGGGVKTLNDINKLLQSGADKITLNSHLFGNWLFIEKIANKFGSQVIVVSVDYTDKYTMKWGGMKVQETFSNDLIIRECKSIEKLGAGEILLNHINSEGTMSGYNLETITTISEAVKIPVIANCGCGEPLHMKQAIEAGASAVAASSMFLFKDITPRDCAEYLNKEGIQVRL